jgi:hypothetical protein
MTKRKKTNGQTAIYETPHIKRKVQTHNYINRQNQSTTGKLWKP